MATPDKINIEFSEDSQRRLEAALRQVLVADPNRDAQIQDILKRVEALEAELHRRTYPGSKYGDGGPVRGSSYGSEPDYPDPPYLVN